MRPSISSITASVIGLERSSSARSAHASSQRPTQSSFARRRFPAERTAATCGVSAPRDLCFSGTFALSGAGRGLGEALPRRQTGGDGDCGGHRGAGRSPLRPVRRGKPGARPVLHRLRRAALRGRAAGGAEARLGALRRPRRVDRESRRGRPRGRPGDARPLPRVGEAPDRGLRRRAREVHRRRGHGGLRRPGRARRRRRACGAGRVARARGHRRAQHRARARPGGACRRRHRRGRRLRRSGADGRVRDRRRRQHRLATAERRAGRSSDRRRRDPPCDAACDPLRVIRAGRRERQSGAGRGVGRGRAVARPGRPADPRHRARRPRAGARPDGVALAARASPSLDRISSPSPAHPGSGSRGSAARSRRSSTATAAASCAGAASRTRSRPATRRSRASSTPPAASSSPTRSPSHARSCAPRSTT